MFGRQLPRLYRSISTVEPYLPSPSPTGIPSLLTNHRDAHTSLNISDPSPPLSDEPSSSRSISLTQTEENRANWSDSDSNSSGSNGAGETISQGRSSPPQQSTQLVSAEHTPHSSGPSYSNPPFHTHQFFTALEKTFPTPTARSLMRATRALLVDRVGRVRREGLTVKDLDNVRIYVTAKA